MSFSAQKALEAFEAFAQKSLDCQLAAEEALRGGGLGREMRPDRLAAMWADCAALKGGLSS